MCLYFHTACTQKLFVLKASFKSLVTDNTALSEYLYLISPWSVGHHFYALKALGVHFCEECCSWGVLAHVNTLTKVYQLHKTISASKNNLWVKASWQVRTEKKKLQIMVCIPF